MPSEGATRTIPTWREAARLAHAVVAVRALAWSLRWRGFAATHERAQSAARRASRTDVELTRGEAERIAALVALASRIARARCLPRSLLLYTWLGRAGAPVQLRIGVRRQAHTLRAHAWVEWTAPGSAPLPLGEPSTVANDFAPLRGGLAGAASLDGENLKASDFVGA